MRRAPADRFHIQSTERRLEAVFDSVIILSAAIDSYVHSACWTQRYTGHWFDCMPGSERYLKPSAYSSQQNRSFHQREIVADADPWPASKREIGIPGKIVFVLG